MGFMAGFGKAFSNSFENAQTRKAEKEKDAFRIAYDTITSRKGAYDKASSEDSAAMKKAQLMIDDAGVDASALGDTAERIRSGYSDKDVRDWLKKNSFAPLPSTESTPATPTIEPATMETQTEQALGGQTATANQGGPNPFEQAGKLITDILDPTKRQEGRIAQANTQVQEAMGLTEEEFNSIMGGYTPQSLPGAQITPKGGSFEFESDPNKSLYLIMKDGTQRQGYVYGPGVFSTLDGVQIPADLVDSQRTSQADDDLRQLYTSMPETRPAMEARDTAVGLTESLYQMDKLAQANNVVLTRAAGLPVALQEIGNEMIALGDQIGSWMPGEESQKRTEWINKTAEPLIAAGMDSGDAQAYAAYEISVRYDIARMMSGPGALANFDVQLAERVLKTNDAPTFTRLAKQLAVKSAREADISIERLKREYAVQEAAKRNADIASGLVGVEEGLSDEARDWMLLTDTNVEPEQAQQETALPAPKVDELPPPEELITLNVTSNTVQALKNRYPDLKAGAQGWKYYILNGTDVYLVDPDGNTIPMEE